MTLLQLSAVLSQRLEVAAPHQLFLAVEDGMALPSLLAPLALIHSRHRDGDGFLYLHYSSQECYG